MREERRSCLRQMPMGFVHPDGRAHHPFMSVSRQANASSVPPGVDVELYARNSFRVTLLVRACQKLYGSLLPHRGR